MQDFWEDKFAGEPYLYGTEPNAFIKAQAGRLKPGAKVLCLAEGEGRNAAFLAALGHSVKAVDFSAQALKKARQLAADRQVSIATEQADLTRWQCDETYHAITATYLHLDEATALTVFQTVLDRLEPGGLFIGEFFSKKQLDYASGGPKNPDLLYETALFEKLGLEPLHLEETIAQLNEGHGHQGPGAVIRVVLKR